MTPVTADTAISRSRGSGTACEGGASAPVRHLSRWIGLMTATIALLPFAPLLLPDGRVIPDNLYCDYESFQLPVREFARSELLQGRFPLWIPYLGCGAPLHAGQQASLCHPLLTPLVVMLGANHGIKVCLFIQIAIVFAGAYLLARELAISEWGASLAGLVASWGSFVVLHLMEGHVTIVLEYALVPWLFLALIRLLRHPGPRPAAMLSCAVGAMLVAGQPQICYYGLLFAGFWAAGSLWLGDGASRRAGAIVWGLTSLVCGSLLGSAQLLPAMELSRDGMPLSDRGGLEYAGRYALDARDFARFFAPNAAGNPLRGIKRLDSDDFFHERILYFGILPSALAVFALTRRGNPRWVWGAASLVLLGLAIALGRSTPAFDLLGAVLPGLSLFRCPGRIGAVMTIFVAQLAGRGLDGWARRAPVSLGLDVWKPVVAAWIFGNLAALNVASFNSPHGWSEYLAYARQHAAAELAVSASLVASAAAVFFVLPFLAERRRNWCYIAALAMTALDLGFESSANVSLAQPTTILPPPSVVTDRQAARVVEARRELRFGKHSLNYSRIVPMLVNARMSAVVTNEGGVLPSGLARLHQAIEEHPKTALAVSSCNWACATSPDTWRELRGALPRCRLIPERFREIVETPVGDIRPADVAKLRGALTGEIEIADERPQSLKLVATAPGRSILVLADIAYPGWKCEVDGRPAALKAAHRVFRAVDLPAGKHAVQFRFSSLAFQVGVGCSLIGAVFVACLVALPALPTGVRGAAYSSPLVRAHAANGRRGILTAIAKCRAPAAMFAIAALLLAPLACSRPLRGADHSLRWGLPDINSGDEPHYLLMVNSVLNDGDLDLSNNHRAVHLGSRDAGRRFAGELIDRQVNWYAADGELRSWPFVFDTDRSHWRRDTNGALIAPLRSGEGAQAPLHEYCWHPPGLPLMLATALFPLRGTRFVEPAALLCSAVATVAAAWLFFLLIRPFAARENQALFAMAIAFLGTPAWHYGRTLFTEPFLIACAIGSYWLYLRRRQSLAAGVVLAFGATLKPPFAVLAVPLVVDRLLAKDARAICQLVFALLAAIAAIIGAGCLTWVSVIACWGMWHGGHCYGPRLIVPVVPLFLVPLATVPQQGWWRVRSSRRLAMALGGISVAFNAVGAFGCGYSFGVHDGSIREISFKIDAEVHRRLGNRKDGEVIDGADLQ